MYSVADNTEINETTYVPDADVDHAINKWRDFPASVISHHGERCCQLAREWIFATDFSQLSDGKTHTGPRWLRSKFKWGASVWSMHWCEAVRLKTLDCGALAALSHEIFIARGVKSYPVQLIQRYTENSSRHWVKKWDGEGTSVHWIERDLIYHEGCAIESGNREIKIWDSTAGWWINHKQFGGYGGVVALRLSDNDHKAPSELYWGTHRITPNIWQKIEKAREDFV